jgi:hypothetical protein
LSYSISDKQSSQMILLGSHSFSFPDLITLIHSSNQSSVLFGHKHIPATLPSSPYALRIIPTASASLF